MPRPSYSTPCNPTLADLFQVIAAELQRQRRAEVTRGLIDYLALNYLWSPDIIELAAIVSGLTLEQWRQMAYDADNL